MPEGLYRYVSVIAAALYEQDGLEKELLALGADDFTDKPVRSEVVRLRVKNVLHKA